MEISLLCCALVESSGDLRTFTVSHHRGGFSKISMRCQRPLNALVSYA
ncbi:hypothetical protein T4A_2092 [Trichinella pseudospiralis]|uniref:Uncharacterized protein n=1 Tax=Trichinella pseudospiralis TaxID=6337 RepID=A0A0V1DPA5_TRIPS|nr:hypothetical protein T4A_2092 [Trichinella pseudospiralis]